MLETTGQLHEKLKLENCLGKCVENYSGKSAWRATWKTCVIKSAWGSAWKTNTGKSTWRTACKIYVTSAWGVRGKQMSEDAGCIVGTWSQFKEKANNYACCSISVAFWWIVRICALWRMLAKCRDLHTFSLTNLGEMLRFTRFDACWQNVAIHALCQAQNFGCQALSTILHPWVYPRSFILA